MKDVITVNRRPRNAIGRAGFMIVLYLCYVVARTLWLLVCVMQFLAHLFTGRPTEIGMRWGEGLSGWIHQMMLFMSYSTEAMPFPFAENSRLPD